MKKVLKSKAGFTLIELMVVIGIIGVLSTIVYANLGSARGSSRNAERQSDIRNLQTAIELYKKQYGTYPTAGCGTSPLVIVSESCPTYIENLAPEFISVLPKDPQRGSAAGYSYVTNSAGTVFKVMALDTVESEVVTVDHDFRSCDTGTNGICAVTGVCSPSSARYQKSYAAWGGYADGDDEAEVRVSSAAVLCK